MQTRTSRTPRTFRLNDAELAAIREAAAVVRMDWTTFVRRAALAAAGRQLAPVTVDVDGENLPLTDNPVV